MSEARARERIDALLNAAGWDVQDASEVSIHRRRGVAVRQFPLPGHGFADYMLYADGRAAGVIEAKAVGTTLRGVERQSEKYNAGLPASLPIWSRPLSFVYQCFGWAPESMVTAIPVSDESPVEFTGEIAVTTVMSIAAWVIMPSRKSWAQFKNTLDGKVHAASSVPWSRRNTS
jgi:type I restriction enzyme R subunit